MPTKPTSVQSLRFISAADARFEKWLREEVQASVADKRAPIRIDEVFRRVKAKVASMNARRTSLRKPRG
jgi:hypothetical protein